MEKTLLQIIRKKGSICSAECSVSGDADYESIGASLLTLMDSDEKFARTVVAYTAAYLCRRDEVAETVRKAKRSGEIKFSN